MSTHLPLEPDVLADFCRRRGIRTLSLFGSLQKGTARPDSDVDLVVEFELGKEPGLIAFAAMEIELSDLMGGRQVDLRTPHDLSRYFRAHVLQSAEVQYERR